MAEEKKQVILGGQGRPGGVGAPYQGGARRDDSVNVSSHVEWIKKTERLGLLGNEELVKHADELGRQLAQVLNTTQIRRLLARVNALSIRFQRSFDQNEVPLLKVRLVYAAAREKRSVGPLAEVLLPAVDRIREAEDYQWFARFVEAVVAYHRFHDGRD